MPAPIETETAIRQERPAEPPVPYTPALPKAIFGATEFRLSARDWLVTLVLFALVVILTPIIWKHIERFDVGPDYRIPYKLSNDYWLYNWRLDKVTDPSKIVLLGDSVVWGEYVSPDGTLSHFLNQVTDDTNRFINGGVDGIFPLAEEGLITYYGKSLRHRRVIVQCNPLWLTSPNADLSLEKEQHFNHSGLVPQLSQRIPSYKAPATTRLNAVVLREIPFLQWVCHIQDAYFGQKSILQWTLVQDGGKYPNAYKDPLSQITLTVPPDPKVDPERGVNSPRHKPWSTNGIPTASFQWVPLNKSVQWQAFQRLIHLLRDERGDDVLVILGPFNVHIMVQKNRPAYYQIRNGIAQWLKQNHVPMVEPKVLPSDLYADASHPLTQGYELLAKRIASSPAFQNWLKPTAGVTRDASHSRSKQ